MKRIRMIGCFLSCDQSWSFFFLQTSLTFWQFFVFFLAEFYSIFLFQCFSVLRLDIFFLC